jgi:hypothetical protein
MRRISLLGTIFVIGLFLTGCGSQQTQTGVNATLAGEYWAKDNLDLQRVGDLLERADSPQEFEAYLNEDDGINNLDLNGDGYVDYISVDEFEDRGDYERGLSMFCRFGPDEIQEIAEIFFYRDDLNYPGSRVLIRGNEQIYGDYYFETNWLDRNVELVTFLFNPRDEYYHSPYYVDNYPPNYAVYEIVETPVYRTRVERAYPQPAFVYTTAPVVLNKVKIKSPHRERRIERIFARLEKPTREQREFIRNNPRRPETVRAIRQARPDIRGGDRPGRTDAPQPEVQPRDVRSAQPERGGPPRPERVERPNFEPSKPARVERSRAEPPRPGGVERRRVDQPRPARAERPNIGQPRPTRVVNPPRPARVERPRMNAPRPARVEQPRMNAPRPARVEQPKMNAPRPARVEQPRMNAPRPASPGGAPARGGGRGKKP